MAICNFSEFSGEKFSLIYNQERKVQVNHNHFLGYTKDEDGNLIIDEDEAAIVKRIFREYLEGASFRDIARLKLAERDTNDI